MKRAGGVLMPISSLPSKYGIGCFDEEAYAFIDRLYESGQSYWQVLPMGPTGFGDSPYQSFSTFAGNPYFISLESFVKKGFLTARECELSVAGISDSSVRYDHLYERRFKLLRKAYEKSSVETDPDYAAFVTDNAFWLPDYALFMAIKDSLGGRSYTEWDEDIRLRHSEAMVTYKNKLINEVNFYQFLQYEFYTQWKSIREYANSKGIKIIGDIPIYVSPDSSDTWASPQLFQLDKNGKPTAVAGCPPDAFSEKGQLWGNPLYDWEKHKETGYEWWISRIKSIYEVFDVVRIDHFRGFDEYYSIPYGAKDAVNGKWEKGPGLDLFRAAKRELGDFEVIAEDLGFLTDSVIEMRKDSGFPGMKILQFAFDTREDSDYLPYKYERNSVVYTGTHDNSTTVGWLKSMKKEDKEVAARYMGVSRFASAKKMAWRMVETAQESVSDLCIIPMQDYLLLGDEARINIPSTLGINWQWRMKKGAFTDKLCKKIYDMTKLYGRLPVDDDR